MRRRLALFILLSSSTALASVAACSSPATEADRLPTSPAQEAGSSSGDTTDPTQLDSGITPVPEASTGGPGRVYAHTPDTLYLYEPIGNTLTVVGKFSCIDPTTDARDVVTDIAVDRTGLMFGTTFDWTLTIDPITAKCTRLALAGSLDPPNGLSFVPAGTVDPGKEALVGYSSPFMVDDAVNYVRIDTTSGDIQDPPIGNMNASMTGAQYRCSGDIISIIQDNNSAYATVKLVTDGGLVGTDLLAEVDPSDGHVKRVIGDTMQNDIYGLGYWAGKGYGFTGSGQILEIDMTNGSSTVVKTLTDDAGVPVAWYGAGVTTQAPIH
jgi:hypothetical protein